VGARVLTPKERIGLTKKAFAVLVERLAPVPLIMILLVITLKKFISSGSKIKNQHHKLKAAHLMPTTLQN
jgi:hypothetical protein